VLTIPDDHASSIENAIANALKKKGIEPPMPRMRSSNQDLGDASLEGSGELLSGGGNHLQQPSRSSRRRKRKKEREREQKKDKEHQVRPTLIFHLFQPLIGHP